MNFDILCYHYDEIMLVRVLIDIIYPVVAHLVVNAVDKTWIICSGIIMKKWLTLLTKMMYDFLVVILDLCVRCSVVDILFVVIILLFLPLLLVIQSSNAFNS